MVKNTGQLILCMLGKILTADIWNEIFCYFFQKTEFDISCKLSPKKTIFMKCQNLFSWKNDKNIIILSSAELA